MTSITNLYWPITGQYCHKLTQYHQVPLLIHHLVRHSSANYIIFPFTTHLMSHAQFTWSSFLHSSPKTTASWLSQTWKMRRQGREGRRAAIQATAGGIQEEQLIFVRKNSQASKKQQKCLRWKNDKYQGSSMWRSWTGGGWPPGAWILKTQYEYGIKLNTEWVWETYVDRWSFDQCSMSNYCCTGGFEE